MNLFYLASLLIILNVCVYGLPLEPGESETIGVTIEGGWHVANLENSLAAAESDHHRYHREQGRKKFFLNPAKLAHRIKAKKALENYKAHSENVNQLALAQTTGVVKVTRSKSGNKNHYEAVHF